MTIYMAEDRVIELENNIALATFRKADMTERIAEWEKELKELNAKINRFYARHNAN